MVKDILRRFPLYRVYRKWRQKHQLLAWEKNGSPPPPPHIKKQEVLKKYAQEYALRTFVETGTYMGNMVEAMKNTFADIYSVELEDFLYKRAKKRFRRHKHIKIIHGDSGKVLKELMPNLTTPTLFWLDGHYSGKLTSQGEKDTPVYEELTQIFSSPDIGHVIIIDDARCFGSPDYQDYPSLSELKKFILSAHPNVQISVETDSIRITPRK